MTNYIDIQLDSFEEFSSFDDEDEDQLQQIKTLNQYIPFKDEIESCRLKLLHQIKSNAARAFLSCDESLLKWIDSFNTYLSLYSCGFSKKEHAHFINVILKAMESMQNDCVLFPKLSQLLNILLRDTKLLTRKDLELDWRIFYNFLTNIYDSPNYKAKIMNFSKSHRTRFIKLISFARVYFSTNATQEMLDEWKQYLCIYSNKFDRYIEYFSIFLPTLMYPEENEFGFKLWFDDFMKLWVAISKKSSASNITKLLSRLAEDAAGYVDWEPHLETIFNRFLYLFTTTKYSYRIEKIKEVFVHIKWIIFMISPKSECMNFVKKLFMIRSNLHKLDMFAVLLSSLTTRLVISRYRKENRKNCWYNFTPQEHLLNDETMKEYSELIYDCFVEPYFNQNSSYFHFEQLYEIVIFNPELYYKKVLEKLDLAYEQISEPDRMTSVLKIFSVLIFPLVRHEKIGPEFRSNYLIPLLFQIASSISPYDHYQCTLKLYALRSIVLLGFPFMDCSSQASGTENEHEAQFCLSSTQLEDFVIQYVNCCLMIVESNNENLFYLLSSDSQYKGLLLETLATMLLRTSDDTLKQTIEKVFSFVTSNIIENEKCWPILKDIIGGCALANSKLVLHKFFPYVSEHILSLLQEKSIFTEVSKIELFYYIYLLNCLFVCDGKNLVEYQDKIVELLTNIFKVKIEPKQTIFNTLYSILTTLNNTYVIHSQLDSEKLTKESIFFTSWPHLITLSNSNVLWHVPNEEEKEFSRVLVDTFIKAQLTHLEKWSESETLELSKNELEKSLKIIRCSGAIYAALPAFESPIMMTKYLSYLNHEDDFYAVAQFKGLRDEIVNVMHKVLTKLDRSSSDSIPAIQTIIKICDEMLFNFDDHSVFKPLVTKGVKTKYIYRLLSGEQKYLPYLHEKALIYHNLFVESTFKYMFNSNFTQIHHLISADMLKLSTCSNRKIRSEAQLVLLDIFRTYPNSSTLFIDDMVANLRNTEDPKAFKGTLYLIQGSSGNSILSSGDWESLLKLYPALIESNFAEKPDIALIFDSGLKQLTDHLYTKPLRKEFLLEEFKSLFENGKDVNFEMLSSDEIQTLSQSITQFNEDSQQQYFRLIDTLISILENRNLHWRFHWFGMSLLNTLIRFDTEFPTKAVQFYLHNLIHESVKIRKTSSIGLERILFLLKPKKLLSKHSIDEFLESNKRIDCYESESIYQNTVFFDNPFCGYYKIPFITTRTYSDQLGNKQQVALFSQQFGDSKFIDKLFEFNSIENEKKLNYSNIRFWKYYFQIDGLSNCKVIFPKIEENFSKKKYYFDKYALEILSGLARAMKLFNYQDACQAKSFFISILQKYLLTFSSESFQYWQYFFKSLFRNRDFKRTLWAFEFVCKENLNSSLSPYYHSALINFLDTLLLNNWKFPSISAEVLKYLLENLSHTYQNVRLSIGSALALVFVEDIGFSSIETLVQNKISRQELIVELVRQLDTKLSPLLVLSTNRGFINGEHVPDVSIIKSNAFDHNTQEGKELLNMVETICYFIQQSFKMPNLIQKSDFIPLFDYLALVQTTNDVLMKKITSTLYQISSDYTFQDDMNAILTGIQKIAINQSWHSRKVITTCLQYVTYYNFFTFTQNETYINSILDTVLTLLNDDVIEVREATCKTLSYLISWNFIKKAKILELIELFKEKSLVRSSNSAQVEGAKRTVDPKDLQVRHTGILGLCALVGAFPNEIPPFLPNVLVFLTEHLSDPQPISKSVRETLGAFKKSHIENWIVYKQLFTADQLVEITNILISPSYYA